LAVRAFDHFLFAANRNRRHEKKQRDKTHSRFFGELRERAATATANRFRSFLRTPGEEFCADD